MRDKLRVFISSKIDELSEERKIISNALKKIHVDSFLFERDAGARGKPVEITCTNELDNSDLYIGIFWNMNSEPSKNEYFYAVKHKISTLIYEKELNSEKRDPILQAFLKEINNSQRGVTYQSFKESAELRDYVIRDVQRWQLEKILKPDNRPFVKLPSKNIDWGDAPNFDEIVGREKEIAEWKSLIADNDKKIFFISGSAGIGKTSFTYKLVNSLEKKYDFIIWKSIFNSPKLEEIIRSILLLITKSDISDLLNDTKELRDKFFSELERNKCLIIFDNFDAILKSDGENIEYINQYNEYSEFLDEICRINHNSQILINSRKIPSSIKSLEKITPKVVIKELSGLDKQSSKRLFLINSISPESSFDFENVIKLCNGHPATIEILAKYLNGFSSAEISNYLHLKEKDLSINLNNIIGDQIDRLTRKELEVIYWLAINRSYITFTDLYQDISSSNSKANLANTLAILRKHLPILINNNSYSIQPILIEYFSERLVGQIIRELEIYINNFGGLCTANKINLYHLTNFALLKTTIKDHIRKGQEEFLLKPIINELIDQYKNRKEHTDVLIKIAEKLKEQSKIEIGYSVGNIINLLLLSRNELKNLDFSEMPIAHAYLRGKVLNNVDFHNAELINSVFTDTFGLILSMAFSKDGNILATGSGNSDIQLWEMPGKKQFRSLIGHDSWVVSLDFSPDNRKLASGGNDHKIFIWDIATGKPSLPLTRHKESVRSVSFNFDGKYLASGSEDKYIRIWDVKTGNIVNTFKTDNPLRTVKFHPKKNILVSGGNNPKIQIWDIDSGSWIGEFPGHEGWVRSLAFSSDGEKLASSSSDRTIKIWDFDEGKCIGTLKGHNKPVMVITFGKDANTLISSSNDKTLRIWDLQNNYSKVLSGHENWVRALSFCSTQDLIASGSDDLTIKFWDPNDRECISTLNAYTNPIWSIDSDSSENLLASCGNDGIQILDITKKEITNNLAGHTQRIWSVAFSPDGKNIVSGSDDLTVRIWDVDKKECKYILDNHHTKRIWSVDYSPKGDLIVSAGEDKVCFWNAINGEYINDLQKNLDSIHVARFDYTGRYLATGGEDSLIRLWDLKSNKSMILEGHNNFVLDLRFTPDGKNLISSAGDNLIKIWEIQTGKCLDLKGHADRINSIDLNIDKKIIASGSADKTIRLWNFKTGELIRTSEHQEGWIWGVCFLPRENLLVSCSEDGKIIFWDLDLNCKKAVSKNRPYEGLNITGVKGISKPEKFNLIRLGAIDYLSE